MNASEAKQFQKDCLKQLEFIEMGIGVIVNICGDCESGYQFDYTIQTCAKDVSLPFYYSAESFGSYPEALHDALKVAQEQYEAIKDTDAFHKQIKEKNGYEELPF